MRDELGHGVAVGHRELERAPVPRPYVEVGRAVDAPPTRDHAVTLELGRHITSNDESIRGVHETRVNPGKARSQTGGGGRGGVRSRRGGESAWAA